ncbi:hypothetical protein GCM10010123_06060 [Pilimelia anulata]|uniref:histidine kinase n=1 Tax=Pilimelia anulata TaxID=53371 RepID=A0A8J3F6A0_9ACTN|nr:response regulator [Pilimelia anulata]GGJ78935.1 hypothetical protein GCM10010123_06060 [Pilimelia anulata]
MADDPLRYFRIEARELADELSRGVLDLEASPADPEPVGRLLRAAHTLKGAARVVRQGELADRTHAVEDLLVPYRGGGEPVPRDVLTRLLALVDGLDAAVGGLAAPPGEEPAPAAVPAADPADPGAPAGPPEPAPAAAAAGVLPTVRADTRDVDELLDVVGEAYAQFAPLRRQVDAVDRARRTAELLADRLRVRAHDDGAPDRSRESGHATAVRLAGELTALGRHLTDSAAYVQRELDEVRQRAERLRLVPAASIFTPLRRAVRDAADAEGKAATFDAAGGDLRLDPHVLTLVGNALLHVVRNAVAHGIEPAAGRAAAGKPAEGRIAVDVARRGGHAAFRCRDDGAGFDLAALRRAAGATGWRGTGDPDRDLRELVDLLLRGGISTAETVTAVAGRGIGLDVLRDVAEQLGGEVAVETEPGAGTTIELAVPLTVVSLRGLTVRAAGCEATLPLDAVRGCLRLDPDAAAQAAAAGAVPHGGNLLPYVALAGLLPGPPAVGGDTVAVIVAAGDDTAAVGAEALLGASTLVGRPLPDLAPADPIVGGVTIDVEGIPRIVLDPHALVGAAAGGRGAGPAPADREEAVDRSVLVVDDSLTTRMLERSILESAGYHVDLAASGEEGLSKAAGGRYALFLVDIDMPGIDGFTFVERARADTAIGDTPVILVSSRTSAEDRQRGAAAGANAYLAKSEFNQDELLRRIRELVGA